MPKYMDTAATANGVAKRLLELVSEENQPLVADLIAQLVNLGVRCSPLGVQHTVRLNAVREAVRGLPVKVTMEERVNDRTERRYYALITRPVGETVVYAPTVETNGDEE